MGNQVIKQPDGRFAIFCSGTDTIVAWDATADEIVEWFAERAAGDARRAARRLVDLVGLDIPEAAYHQFALSWEEALEIDRAHGGDVSRDYAAEHGVDGAAGSQPQPGR